MNRIWILLALSIWLGACTTTSLPNENPSPPVSTSPIPTPSPKPPQTRNPLPDPNTAPDPDTNSPAQPPPVTPVDMRPARNSDFSRLDFWAQSDVQPAFLAFQRNCDLWQKLPSSAMLSTQHPEFGNISDWLPLCQSGAGVGQGPEAAKAFFETHFDLISLSSNASNSGLLTGYYQPEINVRATPDAEFSEAILAVPARENYQLLPRHQIEPYMARVIAYGRPIDVFFMQIQGSGVIAFENGYRVRAAYAANNGHAYSSIGSVLVRRGEMTIDQASKQAIEGWMQRNGPVRTKALMNENARYIFFAEETLVQGQGPMGAMGVPLTAMGSMAIDSAYYPYGVPLWVTVNIPQYAGDYRGSQQGQLLIAQDTGKAIRGARRGDIYFGEGFDAGARAGVMKHRGQWTMLLPRGLVSRLPAS